MNVNKLSNEDMKLVTEAKAEINDAIKTLKGAHKLLKNSNWTRLAASKRLPNGENAYCAIGAIDACNIYGGYGLAVDVCDTVCSNGDIVDFNDYIAKEKRDVLRKFRRAIRTLESKKFVNKYVKDVLNDNGFYNEW